ncbi:MAG: BolA family transcriptional regulator [Polyangiaceae bacterium]|jgi:BolA protein|nr:BolA family transcriptional regulator [Polyangiaceae bacterium]
MSRAERIRDALRALTPVHLDVIDESHMHSVPEGAESHFKLVVVSEAFRGQGRVQRQRAINGLLKDELAHGLHALSFTTFTPEEWSEAPSVAASPKCLGGSKADG